MLDPTADVPTLLPLPAAAQTIDMFVVFVMIAPGPVLVVAQPVPIDTTAIAVMVALVLLEF